MKARDWAALGALLAEDVRYEVPQSRSCCAAGLIARITDFWPEPYDPPARRVGLAERY